MKKTKIKKLKKLPKSADKRTKDRVEALLEDVNGNFKAFGESLDFTRETLRRDMAGINSKLDNIEIRLGSIEIEIISMKNDIAEIKPLLFKEVDIQKLQNLEKRVIVMEKFLKVKLAMV